MQKSFRRLAFLAGLVLALMVGALIWGGGTKTPPTSPLPVPNGWDQYLTAGLKVMGDPPNFKNASRYDLKGFLDGNREALQLVHVGLTQRCQVPIQWNEAYLLKTPTEATAIKRAYGLIRAEALLASAEGRTNDLGRMLIDGIRFADSSARGGLLIHGMMALAIEAPFLADLEAAVPRLELVSGKSALAELQTLQDIQEPASAVLQNEFLFMRATRPFQTRMLLFMDKFNGGKFTAAHRSYETKRAAKEKKRGELLLALATRCYELEHEGRRPTPTDLVPGYLKQLPAAAAAVPAKRMGE